MARILLWHGYLLSGSGSNIYTANIARVWREAGHDVLLLCQDRLAHEYGFVDAAGDFTSDNRQVDATMTGAPTARGRCSVARPSIGPVLPVYVLDEYEGFEAKRFTDLSDTELEVYTHRNVEALVAATQTHSPDAVIVGHEVMGPYIARVAQTRTGVGYLAKLHGSALEYAVKRQARYRRYASDGLGGAAVVTGGSAYMIDEAASIVPGWRERAAVVNPGCDVDLFRPVPGVRHDGPIVGFVGKLIAAKGVHNLLACVGLTRIPGLSVEVVGYGELAQDLRALADAFGAGERMRTETIAARPGRGLESLARWLRARRDDEAYWRRAAAVPVTWHGRLDHGPLAGVLPGFDLLAVPSVVPEAFGMVAAEAAACGVLPLVPRHSGIGEVGAALEAELEAGSLLTYDPGAPVEGLASAVDRVLGLPSGERAAFGRRAARLARARWSWETVADTLLRLARRATTAGPV